MTRVPLPTPSRSRSIARAVVGFAAAVLIAALVCAEAGNTARAASSPPGEIAYVQPAADSGEGDSIFLINADGSSRRLLTRGLGRIGNLAWSPDGSQLAAIAGKATLGDAGVSYRQLYVTNVDSGDSHAIDVGIPSQARAGAWFFGACAWSPDGSRLAIGLQNDGGDSVMGDNWILLLHPVSGLTETLAGPLDYACGSLSWSPDGARLLVSAGAEETGWLETVDVKTGEASPLPKLPQNAYMTWWHSGSYSPDGSRIASVKSTTTQIGNADYDTTSQVRLLTTEGSPDASPLFSGRTSGMPSWSPDGRWLAVGCGMRGTRDSYVRICPVGGDKGWSLTDGAAEPAWRPVSTGAPRPAGQSQASCYGADYGNRDGGSRDIVTTYSPNLAASILHRVGFDADVYLNNSAESALTRLQNDTVFYFDGHGSSDGIFFEEPNDGRQSCLRTSDSWSWSFGRASVALGHTNLHSLGLAVLNACECGKEPDRAGNVLHEFSDQGAACVIGFDRVIGVAPGNRWAEAFFGYACAEGLEVEDAAAKAAEDSREASLFCWADGGIDRGAVVVKRAKSMTGVYIDQSPPLAFTNGLSEY